MKLLSSIGITALIAAFGLVYALGYRHGHSAATDEYDRQQAAVTAQREQELRAEYERQIAAGDDAVRRLRAEKAAIAARAQQLEERIAHVTQHYRPAPDAAPEPRPACVFTHGFVGLYNSAISLAVSAADPAAGADGTASTTGAAAPDPLGVSGVRQSDILHHITGYGSRCQQIEAQLNALIDHLNQIQESD